MHAFPINNYASFRIQQMRTWVSATLESYNLIRLHLWSQISGNKICRYVVKRKKQVAFIEYILHARYYTIHFLETRFHYLFNSHSHTLSHLGLWTWESSCPAHFLDPFCPHQCYSPLIPLST